MSEQKHKKEVRLTLTPELIIRIVAIIGLIAVMAFLLTHKI